jgi:hypothetical protein
MSGKRQGAFAHANPRGALLAAGAGRPRARDALVSAGARPPRARGPLATALAVAGAWLLEPAEPPREALVSAAAPGRPVIAVFGLANGCGTTTVARALAAELATRDSCAAAAVHCEARAAGIPLATHAAGRLARALADVPGAHTRAVGRLCLVGGADGAALADTARHFAPLVLDAGSTSLGGVPAAIADLVIVVAAPANTPALAAVAAHCLARVGHEPIVVVNRMPGDPSDWAGLAAEALPESRMGAQLALGGREARGELGRAIGRLADRCEASG